MVTNPYDKDEEPVLASQPMLAKTVSQQVPNILQLSGRNNLGLNSEVVINQHADDFEESKSVIAPQMMSTSMIQLPEKSRKNKKMTSSMDFYLPKKSIRAYNMVGT